MLKGNTDAGGQRPDEARGYRLKLIKADPPAEENVRRQLNTLFVCPASVQLNVAFLVLQPLQAKEESRDSGGFREFASFKLFPRLEGEVRPPPVAHSTVRFRRFTVWYSDGGRWWSRS